MAAVWCSTCGVMCLLASGGQARAARAAWWAMRCWSASRLRGLPCRVGNSGSVGLPPRSVSQPRRTATVPAVSGVMRSLRPLPWQLLCARCRGGCLRRSVWSAPRLGGRSGRPAGAGRGRGGRSWWSGRGWRAAHRIWLGEEGDDGPVGSFRGDGQDALDVGGVLWVVQRGELEQGVDRGQAGVAGPRGVAPVAFEVVQERGDQRGVQVGDVELGDRFPGPRGGEDEQQPQRVPVGGDDVRPARPTSLTNVALTFTLLSRVPGVETSSAGVPGWGASGRGAAGSRAAPLPCLDAVGPAGTCRTWHRAR
jgi:hypothetical protein